MNSVYYTAEESATKSGYVGLVIDSKTHKTLTRTVTTYPSIAWAMQAAERMRNAQMQEVA